jgi:hypothetical protein
MWSLFQEHAWRVRVAGMSYISGIEHGPVRTAAVRAGITDTVFEMLLTACERGFVAASNEKDDDDAN